MNTVNKETFVDVMCMVLFKIHRLFQQFDQKLSFLMKTMF